MRFASILNPIVDLVFPPRCPLCGDAILAQGGLCAGCWNELAIPGTPACVTCQRPFSDSVADGAMCAPCLANPPRHNGIAAATLYNDASRKLVLAFKHGRKIALAPMLSRLITARLGAEKQGWLAIPVPLHRWRLWRRGYNQAALLAGNIAQQTGATLIVDGLVRKKSTPMLGALGRLARERALKGAISVNSRRGAQLKGAKILLIDDVLTSGATSDACLSALKRAGADQVVICCFARVLNEA
jgi:ComF family protein